MCQGINTTNYNKARNARNTAKGQRLSHQVVSQLVRNKSSTVPKVPRVAFSAIFTKMFTEWQYAVCTTTVGRDPSKATLVPDCAFVIIRQKKHAKIVNV